MNTASSFFPAHLTQIGSRLAPAAKSYKHILDKNEQAEDMPDWLKMQVLQQAMHMEWNRYPGLGNGDVEGEIAGQLGLCGEQVVLGSGSAMFITTLLNYFGMQRRQIVIAQPSYSLFDYHCKTYDIAYTPWMLNEQLQYDEQLLPALQPGAVLFVVSPNNPVGNEIPTDMLERILRSNPQALVILDGVYAGFGEEDYSHLLAAYPNLLVLRSMSKEMPVAALRLGYLCGNEAVIGTIRKLMLPFTINPLALAFARHMLFDVDFCEMAAARKSQMKEERERMSALVQQCLPAQAGVVYPSNGNFLLVRVYDNTQFAALLRSLDNAGIKVLNASGMPMLQNCVRISVGDAEATDAVLECMHAVFGAVYMRVA